MSRRRGRDRPYYSLRTIAALAGRGKVKVIGDALRYARRDFGWETDDICQALKELRLSHFWKSEPSRIQPSVMIDVYKATGLRGEDVYTHFYIDPKTGELVVNSFKKL